MVKKKPKPRKATVSTKKRKEIFIKEYASIFGNISAACSKAKINRTTYYRWIEEDKVFKQELKDALDKIHDVVESRLYDIAMFGDKKDSSTLNALKLILFKTRGYSDKVENKVEHKGDGIKFVLERKGERDKTSSK